MTLRAALDRLGRGFRRMWAWAVRTVTRRPASTEGQLAQEAETGVSLGLMAAAAAAPGGPSDEQRIFLASSAVGMRARVSVLLGIPNRSKAQENELHMIERELARMEGRDTPPVKRGFMGAAAANPLLGIAMSPLTWAAVGLVGLTGMNAVQTWRLDHAKHDLGEARAENRTLTQQLSDRTAERDLLKEAVVAADQLSHQTAANLEAERARASRAAAIERRRQREIQNVLTGRDPPAWSLRNDEPLPPGAGDDSPASGDPAGMPR